jgi:hypothetical protein
MIRATLAALALALVPAACQAPLRSAHAKGPLWVGDWCLVESQYNGREPFTNEPIPRTNIYQRPAPDCPPDAGRFTFGPHSLDGLAFEADETSLQVEGWPKAIKKGKR